MGKLVTFACKGNHKVVNFGKLFLGQFSSKTWKIWHEAFLTPQKMGNNFFLTKLICKEGKKNKKPEGGVFHRQNGCQKIRFYECYDICFLNIYEKHPLIGKNCIQSLKKRFCKYLSSFLDAAGWSNNRFFSLLSFSMSCIGF